MMGHYIHLVKGHKNFVWGVLGGKNKGQPESTESAGALGHRLGMLPVQNNFGRLKKCDRATGTGSVIQKYVFFHASIFGGEKDISFKINVLPPRKKKNKN